MNFHRSWRNRGRQGVFRHLKSHLCVLSSLDRLRENSVSMREKNETMMADHHFRSLRTHDRYGAEVRPPRAVRVSKSCSMHLYVHTYIRSLNFSLQSLYSAQREALQGAIRGKRAVHVGIFRFALIDSLSVRLADAISFNFLPHFSLPCKRRCREGV